MSKKTSLIDKINDIFLSVVNPLLLLGIFAVAPHWNKPNAFEEIAKSLMYIGILLLIVGLPVHLIIKEFLMKFKHIGNYPIKISLTESLPQELSNGILLFIIGMVLAIIILVPIGNMIAKKVIEIVF